MALRREQLIIDGKPVEVHLSQGLSTERTVEAERKKQLDAAGKPRKTSWPLALIVMGVVAFLLFNGADMSSILFLFIIYSFIASARKKKKH